MTTEQLRDIIDCVQAFVVVLNSNRRVLLTNFYKITGLPTLSGLVPMGKMLRCALYDDSSNVVPGVYAPCPDCPDCKLKRAVNDTLLNPSHINHTEVGIDLITTNGVVEYDASVSTKHILLNGEDCVVLTLYDITTIKHIADQLADAQRRAEESDKMKTKFLQCMSHEIRTPLNAIVGFSELLTQTEDPGEKKQYIDIINTNNELLLQIISDVLDMAKIESGAMEVSLRPTELTSLLKLAENSAKLKLQPGVSLNCLPGADECIAVTDQKLIGQVLMNLLVNACKFTPKGTITFGYEVYDDEIYFYVQDTGVGIDPEFKGRLFDLFEKDDSFTQGLGLGLPISNAIVKRLGGSIGVESRGTGRGSKFWFTIPYTAPEIEKEQQEEVTAHTAPVSAPATHEDRITILVAEDNASNYLLFESILKRNYDIVHANDGLEAVQLFKEVNPDLILMDINMPNMDGYEAVREIRKLSAEVPVIAVTAYAFVTDRQRILENGFNGYVSKPINMARLEKEINDCLANSGKIE